jgi:CBS domain-containing protein
MICKKTNSLVVIDADGKFVGMVNARTLISKSIPSYLGDDATAAHFASEEIFREEVRKVSNNSVTEIMDEDVMTIREKESLMKAAMIVGQRSQVRIPVLDEDGRPIGLLTRTELKQVIGIFLGIEGCFNG